MFELLHFLRKLVIRFGKNVWGSGQTPYATYRRLGYEDPAQLFIIVALVAVYFFFVSPIKLHTFHPFLLTLNTSRLLTITLLTYLAICGFLVVVGRQFNAEVTLRGVLITWGYTLIPTLLWFLVTSIFFVILPPPRHTTVAGTAFSLLYLAFSLSLLWWKGILYYLTLRFALKLDLMKIILISAFFLPLLFLYSLVLYEVGIFKVPFI